jgi:signal recognition particle receptor subunit beta
MLVDARRIEQADEVLHLLEERGVRYSLAVNEFDGVERYTFDEVRDAHSTSRRVPL